ncbi:unnamed protein product, partial [Choristocarpus tenellus]
MPTCRFENWSPNFTSEERDYRFEDPAVPSVTMPAAQPDSPGDVQVRIDNDIVEKTGEETETYCNGDQAQYLGEDGYWW